MSEAHILQYLPRDSFVHHMDGLSKFLWLLIVAVAMLTFRSLISGAIMLILMWLLALAGAKIPLRHIIRISPILFGVGLMLGFFHSIIQQGNPVVSLGPISIKDNGIIIGLSYFFRISVVVFASYMLIWTTNIRDLMAGLVHIGIPYRFAFGVFIALRFLPVIQREVEAVSAAHAIRGRVKKRSQLARRFQLWQRYVFTIMVNGLRKAEFAATAAQLRGFGTIPVRTYYKPFHWSKSGIGLLVFFLVLIVGLHIAEQLGLAELVPSLTRDLSTL
jgi:energy-coupling factor transport system permease protein